MFGLDLAGAFNAVYDDKAVLQREEIEASISLLTVLVLEGRTTAASDPALTSTAELMEIR